MVESSKINYVRDALHHPQIQGKIESRRQMLNNRFFMGNYYLPGYFKNQIEVFIYNYKSQTYAESLNNVISTRDHFGRDAVIIERRKRSRNQPFKTVP